MTAGLCRTIDDLHLARIGSPWVLNRLVWGVLEQHDEDDFSAFLLGTDEWISKDLDLKKKYPKYSLYQKEIFPHTTHTHTYTLKR